MQRYTASELRAKIAAGESQTDWARIDAMTEEELEASIAADPDWADIPADWYKHAVAAPGTAVQACIDQDVADWFRAQGPDYEARINAVLRSYRDAALAKAG